MEFGSFFFPSFRAGCNKQTFLFPFHPSVVCSSASALLALSLLTAIPIRKPEPGGKWRDCIDTADHWAPHNWQLFLSSTSGDELNRLCKIWWLPKTKGGWGKREGHLTASALLLPGTQGSVQTTSSAQEAKVKNTWKWANLLISGNVCTKEQETKHTATFSLGADATGLSSATVPSSSQLWLCCGKRAGKALHHMLGKVLRSDTGEPVPGTVTNIQESLSMWDTSHRCCFPLLSSISSHRIWATVIRWDGYSSSLPRKNGLGKPSGGFLVLLSLTFKQDSKDLLPHHVLPPFCTC